MPPIALPPLACCVVDDRSDVATLVVCPFCTVSRGEKEPTVPVSLPATCKASIYGPEYK